MPLKYIAIATALLPFVAVHACYLLSAWQGHVDWCLPYLQGCTSISATGREGAAYFVFKGLMIPAAVVMIAYWWLKVQWLRQMGDRAPRTHRQIMALGTIASLGLILYCCVLGSIGDIYRTQRRTGVIIYFGLTFLAQLLSTHRVSQLKIAALHPAQRLQVAICLSMLGLGLLHLGFEAVNANIDDLDDIFEWNFALLMLLYYSSSYGLWRYRDTRISLQ